jgi:hypothetical protein
MNFEKGELLKMKSELFCDNKPRLGFVKEICKTGIMVITATNGIDYRIRTDNKNIEKYSRKG